MRTIKKITHYINITSASTKKLKPGEFEICNMKCFEFGSRINQDSMGSVDPDPHPSRPKWSQKIEQKQRNFLFEELSEGLEASPRARKVNIFL
jgi:hypothetical protein